MIFDHHNKCYKMYKITHTYLKFFYSFTVFIAIVFLHFYYIDDQINVAPVQTDFHSFALWLIIYYKNIYLIFSWIFFPFWRFYFRGIFTVCIHVFFLGFINNYGCQLKCIFNNLHTNFRLYKSFNKHFMIAPKPTSLKQFWVLEV